MYRDGLVYVLQGAAGIVVAGIASSPEEIVEQAARSMPSVVLLDIAMAKTLSLARDFVQVPRVDGVVILGLPETYADIVACLPARVVRFVKHDGNAADLLAAIRAAGGDEAGPAPVATVGGTHCLTARELEILRLMQQGLCNKTISRQLGIELSTVKNHVHSVLAKLRVRSRSEAISLLYRQGKPAPDWDSGILDDRAIA